MAAKLAEIKPDVCFNALHGRFGEDGCIQGVLECAGIPYTHSGVLSSALAMHKERAKDVMGPAGVPVADAEVVTRGQALERHVLEPPYVVKPVAEGSSVGVVIVLQGANRPPELIGQGGAPDDIVMVERYIPGRELTCAVIGDFVSDVIEIVPLKGLAFYDYEAKYAAGGSQARASGRNFTRCLPIGPEIHVGRLPGAWLSWRGAGGLSLRRHEPTGRAS